MSVAVSVVAILTVVLFANATTASRIAGNAEGLHWSNAALGTSALARAAAGQAALFDELTDSGLADAGERSSANAELEETTDALERLAVDAPEGLDEPLALLISALKSRPVVMDLVEARYRAVVPLLQERVSDLEEAIADSNRTADFVAAAVRLLVILIVPTIVVLAYRRRAASQLREAEIQVAAHLEAERAISRAKDQFVAGMSHEIRTPLTGISGFSELLLDTPPGQPLDRDYVKVIHSEAVDLSRMVDDFIVASRIDAGELAIHVEPVDLMELAESVAEPFERKDVKVRLTGDRANALCDRGRTRQILTNLIANAVQHGGPHVGVMIEQRDETISAHVSDDGDGVPPEMESRLFTRFVNDPSAVPTTGSHGLGTWVARELAKSMGGDVVYRQADELTTFRLDLPAVVSEPSRSSPRPSLTSVEA